MKKSYLARLIFTVIIGALMALSVFTGCEPAAEPTKYYTVNFDSNGGSNVSSITVESGKTITKPADPTRDGYTFVCWQDNAESEYDFSKAVTKDFTLYAKWEQASVTTYYTVKFMDGAKELKTERIESGKTVSKPTDPTKTDYTFDKWILSDGSDFNFATAITADINIYAKWTKNQTSEPVTEYVTVKFMDGTSELKSERIEKGETVSRPATPTKEGYTFDKWILSDGSDFNFATAITADTTVYAKWTKNQTSEPVTEYVNVKFMDGTSELKSERIEKGETVSRPTDPTKEGYTFDKWILSDGSDFNFGAAITADTNIYAKWTKNQPTEPVTKYYTVTFNSNQGSTVLSQYVEEGKKAAEPAAPVKDGYIFDGWYKESSFTNKYNFNDGVTADLTLHAKWINDTVTKYTVTFNSNEGSKVSPQEVTRGGKAAVPADPERNGFVFGGWYTTDEFTSLYNFNAAVTSDITLYAKWTPVAEAQVFEVKFETVGGSSVPAQEVNKNDKAAKPKDPIKSGYNFAGWYIGETEYNFNTPVTSNLTLTAKWTENTQPTTPGDNTNSTTITFDNLEVKTYSADTVLSDGLITLKTGNWTVDASGSSITDANGETVSVAQRLKSVGARTMEINLSKYTGNVTIKFFARSASSEDLTRSLTVKDPNSNVIDTLILNKNEQFTFEVSLDGGKKYTLSTSGGINFYGIVIISTTSSTPTPPASSTLTVPEIPANATKIQVSSTSTYKTIAAALTYAATLPASDIKVIEIADGEYKEKLTVSTPNVWLVGSALAEGKSLSATQNNSVVIWYDDISETAGGTDKSASVTVSATDFVAINITFKNYYNTHALYQESLTISSSTQAVALNVNADRAGFYNCKITSYHDTLLANRGKQLYYNCWIEGKTDYIFGQDAIAYFESCNIWTIGSGTSDNNGGYVVAQNPSTSDYYYVFNNCRFDGDANVKDGSAALGRPWGAEMKMVVMNSYISGKFSKTAHTAGTQSGQRYCTMSSREPKPENMIEYNNTGDGAITSSITNTCTYITGNDAKAYTLRNVLTMNGWNVTGDRQDLITFGSAGNYQTFIDNGTMVTSSNLQIATNGTDNSQVKNGTITFNVTEGAVVTISSFSGHTNYSVTIDGGTPSETITGTSWKYVAQGNETIVITAVSSDNYFYSISILY